MISQEIPRFEVPHEHYLRLVPAMRLVAAAEDTQRVARALVLSEGFALHLAACQTPLLAQALILCLATQVRKLRGAPLKMTRLTPTREGEAPLDPQGLGREVFDRLFIPDEEPRVICLDATDSRSDDRDAWLWLFQRLNERRNHLYAINSPMLLLLPLELSVELTRFAPDLWSIRGVGIRLQGQPSGARPEVEELGLPTLDDPSSRELEDVPRLEAIVAELLLRPGPHAKRALIVESRRLATALLEQGEGPRGIDLLQQEVLPAIRSAPNKLLPQLMFDLVETLVRMGGAAPAEQLARTEVLPKLEEIGHHVAIVTLLSRLGDAYRGNKNYERALEILEGEALPRAEALEESEAKAEILVKIVMTLLDRGDLARAKELLATNHNLLAQWLPPDKNAVMYLTLAHTLLEHGDADKAVEILKKRVLPLGAPLGPAGEALTWTALGFAHRARGELQEAISTWGGKALPLYRRQGRQAIVAMMRTLIAGAMIRGGDRDAGLELAKQVAGDHTTWPTSTVREALDRRDATMQLADLLAQYGAELDAQHLLRSALSETSVVWDQVKSALESRLEELMSGATAGEAQRDSFHIEAGPEIYAPEGPWATPNADH